MGASQGRSELIKGALRHGFAGTGLGIFWMLIGSVHEGRPSPQIIFLAIAGGFVGGLVWFFTGRLKVSGGWWYYARCALIGITVSLLLMLMDPVPHDITPRVALIGLTLSAIGGALSGWYYKDYRPPGSTRK